MRQSIKDACEEGMRVGQKDEPVAWYWQGQTPRVSLEEPINSWRSEWKPLYTRTDNDGLRKAASDVLAILIRLEPKDGFDNQSDYEKIDALSAELDKK